MTKLEIEQLEKYAQSQIAGNVWEFSSQNIDELAPIRGRHEIRDQTSATPLVREITEGVQKDLLCKNWQFTTFLHDDGKDDITDISLIFNHPQRERMDIGVKTELYR